MLLRVPCPRRPHARPLCPPRRDVSLLLASSCLQGQPLLSAARALLALGPDGLQLCPGHPPQAGLQPVLSRVDCALRLHHGFSWTAYRQEVWSEAGRPLLEEPERSLHPPESGRLPFLAWLEEMAEAGRIIELMPPGAWLGSGPELEQAMAAGLRLACDQPSGAVTDATAPVISRGARTPSGRGTRVWRVQR